MARARETHWQAQAWHTLGPGQSRSLRLEPGPASADLKPSASAGPSGAKQGTATAVTAVTVPGPGTQARKPRPPVGPPAADGDRLRRNLQAEEVEVEILSTKPEYSEGESYRWD